jgi:Fe-S-cluster containining protein
MNNTARLAKIDDLYKQIPNFKCVEGCTLCCGPVAGSRLEWKRIAEVSGRSMKDIQKEAAANLAKYEATQNHDHMKCPLLKPGGGCSVYDVRPASCRLFGVVEHELMTCPVAGVPERKIPNEQATKILDEIEKLGV